MRTSVNTTNINVLAFFKFEEKGESHLFVLNHITRMNGIVFIFVRIEKMIKLFINELYTLNKLRYKRVFFYHNEAHQMYVLDPSIFLTDEDMIFDVTSSKT